MEIRTDRSVHYFIRRGVTLTLGFMCTCIMYWDFLCVIFCLYIHFWDSNLKGECYLRPSSDNFLMYLAVQFTYLAISISFR